MNVVYGGWGFKPRERLIENTSPVTRYQYTFDICSSFLYPVYSILIIWIDYLFPLFILKACNLQSNWMKSHRRQLSNKYLQIQYLTLGTRRELKGLFNLQDDCKSHNSNKTLGSGEILIFQSKFYKSLTSENMELIFFPCNFQCKQIAWLQL